MPNRNARHKTVVDFSVQNHGSIFLLQAITPAAKNWIEEFLSEDRQTFGSAVAVEPRYVPSIVTAIRNDGLVVASHN
jgi:hypothetical protein